MYKLVADNDEEQIMEAKGYYNNLCAPSTIHFERDYCKVDDVYYTFLLIPSESYPERVYGSWMSFLFNFCEGVDVDVFIEKKDTQTMKDKGRELILQDIIIPLPRVKIKRNWLIRFKPLILLKTHYPRVKNSSISQL